MNNSVARTKYGKAWNRVVEIDLNLVLSPYFEAYNMNFSFTKDGVRARNFSRADHEVLIMVHIPASAIVGYY